MIKNLQEFAGNFPEPWQWFAVAVVSAIPVVESYFGAAIGVLLGLPLLVAILAAMIGNVISMLLFVNGAHAVRTQVRQNRPDENKNVSTRSCTTLLISMGLPGWASWARLCFPRKSLRQRWCLSVQISTRSSCGRSSQLSCGARSLAFLPPWGCRC